MYECLRLYLAPQTLAVWRSRGVGVSTQDSESCDGSSFSTEDFESCDGSSNLPETWHVKFDGTELDENVSRISIKPRCSQFKSILIRVVLAVLFLGFGVGAVVYSVVNSEKGENGSIIPFNLLKSQHCDTEGSYINEYTNRNCEDGGRCTNTTLVTEQPIKWKQNNEAKEIELIYSRGKQYVRISNVTVIRDKENNTCICNTEQNYDTFIRRLCVDLLQRNTSERSVKIDGDEFYRYYGFGSCEIYNFTQVSVEAFLRTSDDTLYSWEIRFQNATSTFRQKYLFPEMKNGSASLDLEKSC
uniref:Ig-like domain-containing protein n=1 Tax=Syphacia muris TaxID=451379 RepID=A0A0N5ANF1_9BILA